LTTSWSLFIFTYRYNQARLRNYFKCCRILIYVRSIIVMLQITFDQSSKFQCRRTDVFDQYSTNWRIRPIFDKLTYSTNIWQIDVFDQYSTNCRIRPIFDKLSYSTNIRQTDVFDQYSTNCRIRRDVFQRNDVHRSGVQSSSF
jgi:hypothetical protein